MTFFRILAGLAVLAGASTPALAQSEVQPGQLAASTDPAYMEQSADLMARCAGLWSSHLKNLADFEHTPEDVTNAETLMRTYATASFVFYVVLEKDNDFILSEIADYRDYYYDLMVEDLNGYENTAIFCGEHYPEAQQIAKIAEDMDN